MHRYTVTQLATLAGVSVRTLHHYDAIGLLTPGGRNASGHRVYDESQVLRLQHILFCRELGMPLRIIRRRLDAPEFDPLTALEKYRAEIVARATRMQRLLETIEATRTHMTGTHVLPDHALFNGFSA